MGIFTIPNLYDTTYILTYNFYFHLPLLHSLSRFKNGLMSFLIKNIIGIKRYI